MNLLAHILAADNDSGWIRIVVVAVFIGISIIGSILQKAKEARDKAQTRKPRAKSPRVRHKPPVARRQQARRPQPIPLEAAAPPIRVSEELRLNQQRQAELERDRKKRLAARTPPESDTNAIEARLVNQRPAQSDTAPQKVSEVGIAVNLENREMAKKAMILHEIFSPPKALRNGGEMWDT
ncbi:MAG: hypothetical protein GY794_15815 [bacterium]|nr:hypothetical protein [bacterium]